MTDTAELRFEDVAADLRSNLNVYWIDGGEVEMIYFAARALDEDDDIQLFRGLEKYAPGQEPGSARFHEELAGKFEPHLQRIFQEGQLGPGEYEVPIAHLRDPATGNLGYSVQDMRHVDVPLADTMRFNVTPEHLILLKHLRLGHKDGLLASHFKRPYGGMSYFALDMADILGEPGPEQEDGYFSQKRDARYRRLHEEMLLTAQAFWSFAKL